MDRAGPDRRESETAHGVHVPAPRRDHGAMDACGRGHRLRAHPDSQAVRAVPEAADDRQRPGEQGCHRAARPRAQPGDLAERRDATGGSGTACRGDRRPGGRRAPRPGHAVAVARGGHRGIRGQWQFVRSQLRVQLRQHDLVPDADDATPHGGRSAKAVRTAFRPGRYAAGAQGHREAVPRAFSIWSSPRPPTSGRIWTYRTVQGSATTWRAFARSNGGSRRWKNGT